MSSRQARAKAARRRHRRPPAAATTATVPAAEGPAPASSGQADPPTVSCRPRLRPGRSWLWALGWVVAFAAAGPRIFPAATVAGAVAQGAVAGAAVVATLALWRALAPRLGRWTALAAVCVLWAAVMGALAWASPNCPGRLGPAGRCGTDEVATYLVIGALTPAMVGLALLPLGGAVRLLRWAGVRALAWRAARAG